MPRGPFSQRARLALLAAAALALVLLCERFADLRGTETDLFPRWYGLRQLLLLGRDPYSAAVTAEIAAQTPFLRGVSAEAAQTAFGFLYPLPGALLLTPLAFLPYLVALAFWLAAGLVALPAAGLLALLAQRPTAPASNRLTAVVLSLLFLPTLWNITLAQPGLAVPPLVAGALFLSRRHPFTAGACLALAALLKPQLVVLLALSWCSFQLWRLVRRCGTGAARFLAGAACATLIPVVIATALLPTWFSAFLAAAAQYARVPAMAPSSPALYVVLGVLLPDPIPVVASLVAALCLLVWTATGWQVHHQQAGADAIRTAELRGAARAIVAGALIVPPAWETSAIMLLVPLAMSLARFERHRALLFVVTSAALSVFLAPVSTVWPWKTGSLIALAYAALLAIAGLIRPAGAPAHGAAAPPGRG